MQEKSCDNCYYASWVSPTNGVCNYKVTLPNSFLRFGSVLPAKGPITNYTKPGCDVWRDNDKD